jgi:GPI ethanolamine phosphate transferase 2/3 subunit F
MPKTTSAPPRVEDRPAEPEMPMQPVLLRDSQLSKTANAVQLAFLAFCLRLQFPKLVGDPVAGLAETIAIAASAQVAWVLVCCPAAGSAAGKAPAHPLLVGLGPLAAWTFSRGAVC